MILVDSSVWIDFFRGKETIQVETLGRLLGEQLLLIGDLIIAEVLQGCPTEFEFNSVKRLFMNLEIVEIGGVDIAIQSARNYRYLRSLGITVRKTIDVLIATCCIENGYSLLHNDRDFEPFVLHLGLMCVIDL